MNSLVRWIKSGNALAYLKTDGITLIMGFSSAEFEEFLKTVLPGMGFNWRRYHRRNIRKRVLHRLDSLGLASVDQYIETLRSGKREYQIFYNLLTVTISRFFRNRTTYEKLRGEIIPDVIERDSRLSIWSIGCAGGEEPYSMAILWDAYLKDKYPNTRPLIRATDIDMECIKRAEAGVYDKSSLKEVPKELIDRYFTHEKCHFVLDEDIKGMVEFRPHDILKDEPLKGVSIILCRNLAFTYFGPELQKKVLDKIYTSLESGGYLIIGRKEALPENTLFEPACPTAGIYRRAD